MEYHGYTISTDKSLLSVDRIMEFLDQTYWANGRSREKVETSIANSALCFGVYYRSEQVGFARVVTDFVSIYWIGDVFIAEEHRGRGLGKRLVRAIVEAPELQGLAGILATRDAHGLYRQFGFESDPENLMRRPRLR